MQPAEFWDVPGFATGMNRPRSKGEVGDESVYKARTDQEAPVDQGRFWAGGSSLANVVLQLSRSLQSGKADLRLENHRSFLGGRTQKEGAHELLRALRQDRRALALTCGSSE